MKESEFRKKVVDFLNTIGYAEFLDANDVKKPNYRLGSQDIFACVNGHYVRVETKVRSNKATEIQLYRHRQVLKANGKSYILYPDQFEAFKKEMEALL